MVYIIDLLPFFMVFFQFEEVFEEASEALVSALGAQHTGVIHALTSACRRLSSKQASCMKVCLFSLCRLTRGKIS